MKERVMKVVDYFRRYADVCIEKAKGCDDVEWAAWYQGRAYSYLMAADVLEAEFAVEMKEGES